MILMGAAWLSTQFGEAELARLAAAATLGDPVAATELSSPRVLARLAEVEVLITSWGCPPIDGDVIAAACRPVRCRSVRPAGGVRPGDPGYHRRERQRGTGGQVHAGRHLVGVQEGAALSRHFYTIGATGARMLAMSPLGCIPVSFWPSISG
jgi:hypothetical protein